MDEQLESTKVAELTTEIVAAYVSHNKVAVSDLPNVITAIGGQLRALGQESSPAAAKKPEPAVSIGRSVRPDHLVCLVCGKKQKLLKRHLSGEHGLTPEQYRELFGLRSDYPMAAPKYAEQRRELALKIGLGRPKKAAGRPRRSGAPKGPRSRGANGSTKAKQPVT